MRIKIIAPYGCSREMLDERGWIEMREDAKVSDALKIVHCGPMKAKLLLVSVNGERAALSQRLHEGDVVGFFMPVSGG